MKRLTEGLEELVGKTISAVKEVNWRDEKIAIFFEDDSFVILAGTGECGVEIDDYDLGLEDQRGLGLISEEEYEVRQSQERREYELRKEQRQREEYKMLKEKFEGKGKEEK